MMSLLLWSNMTPSLAKVSPLPAAAVTVFASVSSRTAGVVCLAALTLWEGVEGHELQRGNNTYCMLACKVQLEPPSCMATCCIARAVDFKPCRH